jgi:uncharacterized membrane protein YcaP (DUF421 family)
METILRGLLIYFLLLIILRISGKRTIQTSTPFGLVLIFLMSSTVADALKDEDRSITNSIILVCTLASIHIVLSFFKTRARTAEKLLDDVPTLIVKDGQLFEKRMKDARVTKEDVLASARGSQVKTLDQIRYAILEVNGKICIIPKED